MMTTDVMDAAELNDAQLVSQSLGGNRDAFRRIVERYQTLIASLAYCATGNVTQSEDLALAGRLDVSLHRDTGSHYRCLAGNGPAEGHGGTQDEGGPAHHWPLPPVAKRQFETPWKKQAPAPGNGGDRSEEGGDGPAAAGRVRRNSGNW